MQPAWQRAMAEAYRHPQDLLEAGLITVATAAALAGPGLPFRTRVPRGYARLIRAELGLGCPILRQALPQHDEVDPLMPPWAQALSQRAWGRALPWQADAIGDLAHQPALRLTHRYGNRAILHVSPACALACRYCFRKTHLSRAEARLYRGSLTPAIDYLRQQVQVREVILTGGDPLSVDDGALANLLAQLAGIGHLRHVRVHTRMPVTLPQRMTIDLARVLAGCGLPVSVTCHFNHPRELSRRARLGLQALRRHGVVLYNQSVLLRGVNDSVTTLATLCQRLFECGVTPYYLHHPDWTPGTFGFRLSICRGQKLVQALAGRLSGPAIPRYVVELPQGLGKVALLHPYVRRLSWRRADGLVGGLWRLPVPHTRGRGGAASALYVDLSVDRSAPGQGQNG